MDVIDAGGKRGSAARVRPVKLFKSSYINGIKGVLGKKQRVRRQPQLSCTVHNLVLPMRPKARKPGVFARQKNGPFLTLAATQ
jgi:hypothetical protein